MLNYRYCSGAGVTMSQEFWSVDLGLEILDKAEKLWIFHGSTNPSVGIDAPVPSLYFYRTGGTSVPYLKVGPATTDWQALGLAGASGSIGDAENGTYADGLFSDFTPDTPVGIAIDRFNSVLAGLVPPQAPLFGSIDSNVFGASAKLSFGASNPVVGVTSAPDVDVNQVFSTATNRLGVVTSGGAIQGDLSTSSAHAFAFPAQVFGNGDKGTLTLIVNNSPVLSVDLATQGSGLVTNGAGDGFNLSAATAVHFENGSSFDRFKYRSGTWIVSGAAQPGYNKVQVQHTVGASVLLSQAIDWIVDGDATALVVSGAQISGVTPSGLRQLSGVKYYTATTLQYQATIQNLFKLTYSAQTVPVTVTVTNGSSAGIALGPIVSHTDPLAISGHTITANNGVRQLNTNVSASLTIDRAHKGVAASLGTALASGLWIDNITTADTAATHNFCTEERRLVGRENSGTNNYDTQIDVTGNAWNSAKLLTDVDLGYSNGLLCYNGSCRYPTRGGNAGDLRNVTDGNLSGPTFGPPGNPNYSGLIGVRQYTFYLQNNSSGSRSNVVLTFSGVGLFNPVAVGAAGEAVTVEIKLPTGALSTTTGWLDAYTDFATNQFADGKGCRNASNGAGRAMGIPWGITFGTKYVAAGEKIVVVISASPSWTGQITQVQAAWS